jgi:hypothetical protein
LFGGSCILGYKAIENNIAKNSMLVIDPLDGYYISDPKAAKVKDELSNCEVTLENLIKNFRSCGVDESQVEVLQEYSTSEKCLSNIMNKKFNFLFIDGDHTEFGVKSDWEKFSVQVVDKGIVVIDNINDWPWREVNLFVHSLFKNQDFINNWGIRAYYRRTIIIQKGVPHDDVIFEALKSSMNYSYHSVINYNRLVRAKAQIPSKASLQKRIANKVKRILLRS